MNQINPRRFKFTDDARPEARHTHGVLFANSVLAIADSYPAYTTYSPIGIDKDGQEVLIGPFVPLFDDMLEEIL